jgi:hypothetical protein
VVFRVQLKKQKQKIGRVEAILHVTAMTACVLVTLSELIDYSSCGLFGSLLALIYVAMVTLGGVFWVPGTFFGLLIHASTRANSEQWSRVTLCFMLVTLVVCVIEAAVFHSNPKHNCFVL